VSALKNPATSVEAKKLELGRQARQHAIESFREYSQVLEEEDIERAAIRAVESAVPSYERWVFLTWPVIVKSVERVITAMSETAI
jgi:hypothetical protein